MLLFWFQEMDFYKMTKSRNSGLKGYHESTMEEASTSHLTLYIILSENKILLDEGGIWIIVAMSIAGPEAFPSSLLLSWP